MPFFEYVQNFYTTSPWPVNLIFARTKKTTFVELIFMIVFLGSISFSAEVNFFIGQAKFLFIVLMKILAYLINYKCL